MGLRLTVHLWETLGRKRSNHTLLYLSFSTSRLSFNNPSLPGCFLVCRGVGLSLV